MLFTFLGGKKKTTNPKTPSNIFIPFKHIPYNKHNEAQGIPMVSSKCKRIASMFLRAIAVI